MVWVYADLQSPSEVYMCPVLVLFTDRTIQPAQWAQVEFPYSVEGDASSSIPSQQHRRIGPALGG